MRGRHRCSEFWRVLNPVSSASFNFPGIIIGALKREISNSFCRPLLLSGVIAATEHLAVLRGEVRGQRRFQRMEVGQGRRRDGRQGPR